jgi:hypothetical protein
MRKGRCLLLTLLTMIISGMTGCDSDDNLPIYGTYTMDELIYHSSLNTATYDQTAEKLGDTQFVIKEKEFRVKSTESTYELTKPIYVTRKMNDELTEQFQSAVSNMLSLTDYKYKYQYEVYDDKERTEYRLYLMDDELWLAIYTTTTEGDELILDLLRLK